MADEKVTFCRICEAGCGLVAQVEDGQVLKLAPDPDHVVSRGYACVKGIKYTELHRSPDRLRTPLKRVGDTFVAIPWSQAFAEIGERLRAIREEHGPQSVGMYGGNPSAFSMLHPLFARAFMMGIGSSNSFSAASQDCNNKFVVAEACYGSAVLQPLPDIDRTRCLILFGTNPAISHMSFVQVPRPVERLKAIEAAGGHVVSVNPRRTETAKQVGEHVGIRPGTDVFMLMAFAREVFELDGVDPHAASLVENLDDLREAARRWTPERSFDVTGVPPEVLRRLVRTYLDADGASLYCSTGVNQGEHGTLAFWLISAINAMTGNLDRAGGTLVPPAQVRMARVMEKLLAGEEPKPSRIGGFAPVMGNYPAAILPDEILKHGDGQIRAMVVTAGNPVLSCANSDHMAKALGRLELLVSIDIFRNETGNLSDYILPATSSFERDDIPLAVQGFQPIPYFQYTDALVAPDGEQKDEWWIFTNLARACGTSLFVPGMDGWLEGSASVEDGSWLPRWLRYRPRWTYSLVAWGSGTTLGSVRRHPHGKLLKPLAPATFLGKKLLRPNKKMDVAPAAFVERASKLSAAYSIERAHRSTMRLITKREKTTHNSWMHNAESLVGSGKRSQNYAYMNPKDAERLKVAADSLVELATETGFVRLVAKLTEDVQEGCVAVAHGWGRKRADGMQVAAATRGANINQLARDGAESVEALSGMSQLTALQVRVGPAASPTVNIARVTPDPG